MAHELAGALQHVSRIRQRRAVKEPHVYVRVEYIDVAEGRISQTCNRAAVMQKLPDFVPAFSHHLKPLMRDGSQFTRMLFHPRIDGGIPLDGAVESQQLRSHCHSTFCLRNRFRDSLRLGVICSTLLSRALRKEPSKDMAFPHPQSRKDHYRKEDKPSCGGIVWKLFKRTINVTEYRNAKDDVNQAKNPTFGALVHDWLLHGFSIHLDSRLLSRIRRPVGRFNTELLCVLGVQSLPAAELHRLGANHAADGSSAKKVIQNIETNVPPGCTHCDEAATDVGPQRQARAATQVFEFPPHIEATPLVLKHLRSVGSRHGCFGNMRRGRSHRGELHRGSNRTQAPIDVEGRPLAQMRRVGQRLPDFFRQVAQFSDENERPLLSVLSYLRPAGRTRGVLLPNGHLLLLLVFLF